MRGIFIILFSIAALIYACEPCPDCGDPLFSEPSIHIKFVDEDSLVKLDASINLSTAKLNILKSEKDSVNKEISQWQITINQLNDSIADGKIEYTAERDAFLDSLDLGTTDLNNNILPLDTALRKADALLKTSKKNVNAGLVRVEKITLIETGRNVSYDSAITAYRLPLLMDNATQTSYEIALDKQINTISFLYQTEIHVDAGGKVRIRAFGIDTVQAGYTYATPPKIDCETSECEDNEVLVTIYF